MNTVVWNTLLQGLILPPVTFGFVSLFIFNIILNSDYESSLVKFKKLNEIVRQAVFEMRILKF